MDGYDEAFREDGTPRGLYEELLEALARRDLVELRARVGSEAVAAGLSFGPDRPLTVDPIPRLLSGAEWEALEAGIAQRTLALNAFVADAYGEQRIVAAGVVPERLLRTAPGYEPQMRGLLDPGPPPVAVAGLDLVRDGEGRFLVLEDNVRMPSGSSYAAALREAVAPALACGLRPRPVGGFAEALAAALRSADPSGGGDPNVALLSDGAASGAWFEHLALARELEIPVLTPAELEVARGRLHARRGRSREPIDVLYRRLDQERLSEPGGEPTALGELLLPPLAAGTLRCLNAFGSGVADDKLAHAHVEAMIRFYLDEEPRLRSVPSIDPAETELAGLDELVLKPRDGFGGRGVTILARAGAAERRWAIAQLRRRPEAFVLQRAVALSFHPTVCGARLQPRRVDLRPFAVVGSNGVAVPPLGLTRFAVGADDMVVNSSRGGGCKDTWVLNR